MDRYARLYVIAVASAAAAFVVGHIYPSDASGVLLGAWGDILAFAFVGVLSQVAAIDFGRDRQSSSSMAFIPFLASAILLPPLGSILVAGAVSACYEFVFTKRPFTKGVFNLAQTVLAVGLAAHAYTALSGGTASSFDVGAFVILVAVFFGVNILLSSVALSLYRAQPFIATFSEVAGPRGGNIIYDLFASWIVVLAVLVYGEYRFWGILVMIVSLIVVRHVYFSRRKLEEANHDLLTVLVKAIETRDPYTSGHSIRVSSLAALIAEDLGLSRRKVERVRRAALLHDIGKIHPEYETVLQKPHQLTPEERSLIETHAARGADLLRNLSSVDSDIIAAVRHHHERWDGKGYPDKLSGTDIPLYARIIMMCDSIDAMLSDRPYRAALTVSKVESELEKHKGSQFDARIVETVLAANTLRKAVALVTDWRRHAQALETEPTRMEITIPTAAAREPDISPRDNEIRRRPRMASA